MYSPPPTIPQLRLPIVDLFYLQSAYDDQAVDLTPIG